MKFRSYREYIAKLVESWPEHLPLHSYLESPQLEWSNSYKNWYSSTPTHLAIVDYMDMTTETQVFRQDDEQVEPEMFTAALNFYGENVKTRIILVTPCDCVPTDIVEALEMALDVDPAFFHVAIGAVASRSRSHTHEQRCEPWIFDTFGKCAMLPSLLCSQTMRVQKQASASIDVGQSSRHH